MEKLIGYFIATMIATALVIVPIVIACFSSPLWLLSLIVLLPIALLIYAIGYIFIE